MDVPPKEFHHFPRLPAELRIMTWKAALWMPNIIQLRFVPVHISNYIAPERVIPPLLHACAESRMLALEVYPGKPFEKDFPGAINYMNSEIDTFYFPFDGCPVDNCNQLPISSPKSFDLERVKYMAINIRYCSNHRVSSIPMSLFRFGTLETLAFVIEDDTDANEPAKLIDLDERDELLLIDIDTEDGPSRVAPRDLLANGSKMLDYFRKQFHPFTSVPQPRLKKLVGKVPGVPFKPEPETVGFK